MKSQAVRSELKFCRKRQFEIISSAFLRWFSLHRLALAPVENRLKNTLTFLGGSMRHASSPVFSGLSRGVCRALPFALPANPLHGICLAPPQRLNCRVKRQSFHLRRLQKSSLRI